MQTAKLTSRFILFASALLFAAATVRAEETLSHLLQESNWDGIIGTWVDADTKGAVIKTTYAWKIEDRVIEVTSKEATKESVALMGVNAAKKEVFHMGADSTGSSFLGKWDVDENGDAVLGLVYTSGEGEQGALSIRLHHEDENTLTMTVELPEPIKVKMIREKPRR